MLEAGASAGEINKARTGMGSVGAGRFRHSDWRNPRREGDI